MPSDNEFIKHFGTREWANLESSDTNVVAAHAIRFHAAHPELYTVRPLAAGEKPPPAPKPSRTLEGDEARVKMMLGKDAVAAVFRNKLEWPGPHPTNPGITAMRAKNALYVAIRHGTKLKL